MRIVIDTGVFISAAIKAQSVPATAVYQATQVGVLLKSEETEAELLNVIDRPYLARLIAPVARARMVRMMEEAGFVNVGERFAACRDPKDDKFLELAVNGRADVILTGDNDLLVLHPFRGISIIAPAAFVRGGSYG